MRRLFWKIFGWFWGAMLFIGVAIFLFVATTRPDPLPQPLRESIGETLSAQAATAALAWETAGQIGLSVTLSRYQRRSRLWLYDDADRELSGRDLERREHHFERRLERHDDFADSGPLGLLAPHAAPVSQELKQLRSDALKNDEAVFLLTGGRVFAAQGMTSPSGKRYVLQAMLPRPRMGRVVAARTQWLALALVVALSGLLCWALVRYLTAPMTALRAATEQLAGGNLTARTGAASRRRRDEVADLGRDFDAMAERIENLVTTQRRLLGDISHELRSPLSRLGLSLALARRAVESKADESETIAALDRIKRESGRLNALIEQLLQLARLESGEGHAVQSNGAPIDLGALLREVVSDADFEARNAHRAVKLVESSSCFVNGSPELLRSAIENVVRNAVHYTAPETSVEVSVICKGENADELTTDAKGEAAIRVRDYGVGVPPESLDQLFRPFYRVATARDRESGGVGLGLAITQRAVASCGGTVSARNVESHNAQSDNAEIAGLLIEIRLPLANLKR